MKFFNNLYKIGVATVQLLDPRSSQQEKLSSALALKDSITTFSNTAQAGKQFYDDSILRAKTGIATASYTALDPIFGEGAVLEPVTVAVDPDRDLGTEYAPQFQGARDISKNLALGLGALALITLVK